MLKEFFMRKGFLFSVLLCFMCFEVGAVVAPQRTSSATVQIPTTSSSNTSSRTNAVTARSATNVRSAAVPQTTSTAVSGRSATTGRTIVNRTSNTATSSTPAVTARVSTTKSVIGSGTKVATAADNVIVSEECRQKYMGCMDSFCMLDNDSGGRCICSDKNAELDSILAEIEKLDQQSYQMATYGVEKIQMGDAADTAIADANAVVDFILNPEKYSKEVDLSLWDLALSEEEEEEEDIFNDVFSMGDAIEGKEGDNLYRAASDICVAQMPECSGEMSMLQLMYSQQIKSDCTAYENSLKQQRNSSAQKLYAAEKALRDAALEQYQVANKYDLGQCAIEFKNCMITTGGCGEDFSNCASIIAFDNTNVNKSTSSGIKNYTIQGAMTNIEISASTYDALVSKKPLCESITKSCVDVADQVWDTFLKEVAPQLKSAELIAEDNARQSCVGSISDCFQKACKDNIDPNDPDGSYDICLTRPETMLSFCKIPLNSCGIDASSAEKAEESSIWDFILARLASMRVNSCTNAVKECLQSEDRCGPDYTQCIGLDTNSIMRICPAEKLVGCQYVYGDEQTIASSEEIYDELWNMVQGIMLNIDNSMLTECQNALNESMIRVCGDTENCDDLAVDNGTGTRSFKYQVCKYSNLDENGGIKWTGLCRDSLDAITEQELIDVPENGGWAGKLSGIVYWGDIEYNVDENSFTDINEYIESLESAGYVVDEDAKEDIQELVYGVEIRALEKSVESAIKTIEADPIVEYCMTGRQVQGMRTSQSEDRLIIGRQGDEPDGRFPNLTKQIRQIIANSALKNARENYNKRYDEEVKRMMQDQVKAAERIDRNMAEELAKQTCVDWAESSALPVSKAPKASNVGKWIAVTMLVAAAAVATVFTFGATAATLIVAASIAVASTGATVGVALGVDDTVGQKNIEQWNYKENITTTFNATTGECTKVRVYQNCSEIKKNYCKRWNNPQEIRDVVQLIEPRNAE